MITFLEQKSIATLYNFGRTHKSVLYQGIGQGKNKKKIPGELNKGLQRLEH